MLITNVRQDITAQELQNLLTINLAKLVCIMTRRVSLLALYVQQVIIAWEEPTTHVPLHAQRSTQQYHTGQLFAQQVSSVKPVSMFLQQMQRTTRTSHSHVQKEPMVDQ